MKKFTIGAIALIAISALVFMGCPRSKVVVDPPTETDGGCMPPTNGEAVAVDLIYGDARYDRCNQLAVAAKDPYGAYVRGGKVGTDLAFVEMDGGERTGENVCGKGYTLSLVTATAVEGGGFIKLAENYDVSAVGKKLYFSVRSPVTGGATSIRVYLEAQAPDGTSDEQIAANYRTATDEGVMEFKNDGDWQLLVVDINEAFSFAASKITAQTVRTIGFALEDQNNLSIGLGVQTISIDEVRFE